MTFNRNCKKPTTITNHIKYKQSLLGSVWKSAKQTSSRKHSQSAMASLLTRMILSINLLIVLTVEPINGAALNFVKEQREFDYFKLSLQWPGTVCRNTRHCCFSNGCCRGYFSFYPDPCMYFLCMYLN